MGTETGFPWYGTISQLAGVLVGGLLVIITGLLSDRRRKRAAFEDHMEHERAVYTGLFAVRNFLVETINAIEPQRITSSDLSALEVAQSNLSRLMDKSSPRGQAFLMVLFDLSLSLENLIATVRRTQTEGKSDTVELAPRMNAIIDALNQFDLVAGDSLDFISQEEIDQMVAGQKLT